MITKWTLQNFKSIYEETTLELAPLTIFAGANSSGKSTLIQSLLLTTQSVQSPVHARSVVLNGHIVRMGSFNDIISNGKEGSSITIGFEVSLPPDVVSTLQKGLNRFYMPFSPEDDNLKSVSCRFSFSATSGSENREVLQLQPYLEHSRVRLHSTNAGIEEVSIRLATRTPEERLRDLKALTRPEAVDLSGLKYEVVKVPPAQIHRHFAYAITGRPVGASVHHFLPINLLVVFDAVRERAKRLFEILAANHNQVDVETVAGIDPIGAAAVEPFIRSELIAALADLKTRVETPMDRTVRELEAMINSPIQSNIIHLVRRLPILARRVVTQRLAEKSEEFQSAFIAGRPEEPSVTYNPIPERMQIGIDYIQLYFERRVRYLGPLRDEPKPVYPLVGASDSRDVGYRGEHTAAVLEVHRQTIVSYVPSAEFRDGGNTARQMKGSLHAAVLDWLSYMGVVSEVQTYDKGKLGHELKVSTGSPDQLHDLTHVGVGVSQVLPILVLSLMADKTSTLIFEQPELHLHPRVQTRLADFFVSMANLGKQCIVETHSEYLINRLRYRSAVSTQEDVSSKVIMYFVEKNDRKSAYRPVKINKYGVIPDWPKGFFDESERTAAEILRAGMEKKRREERQKND